ncbi:MAG: hypothetical protein M0P17_08500 [Methanoculleus sp.]|nr:hypothetical protein [Methanoculleus sp.]
MANTETKIRNVEYESGESAIHPGEPCDYMRCEAVDRAGHDETLYAELPPIEGDETGNYDALRQEILSEAERLDVDSATLRFCYD